MSTTYRRVRTTWRVPVATLMRIRGLLTLSVGSRPRALLEDILSLDDPVAHPLVERLRLDAPHVRAHAHRGAAALPRPILGRLDEGPAHAAPPGAGVHDQTGDLRVEIGLEEAARQDMDPA